MPQITVDIPEPLDQYLEAKANEEDEFSSKGEAISHLAEEGRRQPRELLGG